jgi:hypothetical protein
VVEVADPADDWTVDPAKGVVAVFVPRMLLTLALEDLSESMSAGLEG